MELDGHPTHDIIEELQRRGGIIYSGTRDGPDPKEIEFARRQSDSEAAYWLMLPKEAFETGFDEEIRGE